MEWPLLAIYHLVEKNSSFARHMQDNKKHCPDLSLEAFRLVEDTWNRAIKLHDVTAPCGDYGGDLLRVNAATMYNNHGETSLDQD